jgi:hypothetical protein
VLAAGTGCEADRARRDQKKKCNSSTYYLQVDLERKARFRAASIIYRKSGTKAAQKTSITFPSQQWKEMIPLHAQNIEE